jgi:hypothetical protein
MCCGLLIALLVIRTLPRLNAQTPQPLCNAAMFAQGYSYSVNGTVFTAGALAGFYSIVGVVTADGVGSLSGTDTISENGQVQSGRTYTGTYSVQPNCSGTMTLNYTDQTVPFAIAVSNSGSQVAFLQMSNGAVGVGTAIRQFSTQ